MKIVGLLGTLTLFCFSCATITVEEPEICKTAYIMVDPGNNFTGSVEKEIVFDLGDVVTYLSEVTLSGGQIFLAPSDGGSAANLDFIQSINVVLRGSPDITILDYERSQNDVAKIDIAARSENLLTNLPAKGTKISIAVSGRLPDRQVNMGFMVCIAGRGSKIVNLLDALMGKPL